MIGKFAPLSSIVASQPTIGTTSMFRAIRVPTHHPSDMMRVFKRPFYNRVGLGIESSKTVDFFLQHRLSTAMGGTLRKMANDPAGYAEELKVFKADFKKARGHAIPEEHFAQLEECGRPWQIFNQASQSTLQEENNLPYVDYYREAMETAFARSGEVLFHLGGKFEVSNYVTDIIRTEKREGKSFKDFIDTATYVDLAGPSPKPGAHRSLIKNHATSPSMTGITNIEIYDLTEGAYRYRRDHVRYFSDDGVELETQEFLSRHRALLDVALLDSNRDCVNDRRPMTVEATQAVEAFQRYLKGRERG